MFQYLKKGLTFDVQPLVCLCFTNRNQHHHLLSLFDVNVAVSLLVVQHCVIVIHSVSFQDLSFLSLGVRRDNLVTDDISLVTDDITHRAVVFQCFDECRTKERIDDFQYKTL